MKLTDFENTYLRIEGGKYNFNPCVISLFHTLLQKVEKDPYRQWTHDLLRNYVNATFQLCKTLSSVTDKYINLYDSEDNTLRVFFTGLYTPKTYKGVRNGLYFVGNDSDGFNVMTTKEFVEKYGKNVLEKINCRDSFENELVCNEDLKLENIIFPKAPMKTDTASELLATGESAEREKTAGKRWLHLLIDGIDNLPNDFLKSFFNIPRKNEINYEKLRYRIKNDKDSFKYYQQIIIETITEQICNIQNLPIIYYINPTEYLNEDKDKETVTYKYNYLLPMYLQNSEKPDFCIVLTKIKNTEGDWEPVTSLNMDEVYCDIRVFGKDAIERVRDWW